MDIEGPTTATYLPGCTPPVIIDGFLISGARLIGARSRSWRGGDPALAASALSRHVRQGRDRRACNHHSSGRCCCRGLLATASATLQRRTRGARVEQPRDQDGPASARSLGQPLGTASACSCRQTTALWQKAGQGNPSHRPACGQRHPRNGSLCCCPELQRTRGPSSATLVIHRPTTGAGRWTRSPARPSSPAYSGDNRPRSPCGTSYLAELDLLLADLAESRWEAGRADGARHPRFAGCGGGWRTGGRSWPWPASLGSMAGAGRFGHSPGHRGGGLLLGAGWAAAMRAGGGRR